MPYPTRFLHEYQSAAISRIQRARALLAEAAGMLRAADRATTRTDFAEKQQARPAEHADLVETAETSLRLVARQVSEAPAGSVVG